jgi:hypothetical protein
MSSQEARRLKKGDYVLIHSGQFLLSRGRRRWVRARIVEVRDNTMRPDVPDVVIRISRMRDLLFCSPHELRRAAQKGR